MISGSFCAGFIDLTKVVDHMSTFPGLDTKPLGFVSQQMGKQPKKVETWHFF